MHLVFYFPAATDVGIRSGTLNIASDILQSVERVGGRKGMTDSIGNKIANVCH